MKKLIMFLMTAILAVMACVGFTACGGGDDNKIVNPRTKTITVGYTDYEPMNCTEDGVLKGFDTELALMTFNAL